MAQGPMLEGTTLATLDEKGRLMLPAALRRMLFAEDDAERTLIAARHPDGCLVLYPPAVWAEKREELARLPYSARAFVRLVLGSAVALKADRAGRLLIPASLRALAHLEKQAALIGLGAHLELWDLGRYAALEAQALAAPLDPADFSF